MTFASLLWTCVVRSRCPCCRRGSLFAGRLRLRDECEECGLVYDQWTGEWITPTYLASSFGMLSAFALMIGMLIGGTDSVGPFPAELPISAFGGAVALLALRPCKAGWLAFLWWMGGVEVSARTRARLRWSEVGATPGDAQAASAERIAAAEDRARSRPALRAPGPVARRYVSLRSLLFPGTRPQR